MGHNESSVKKNVHSMKYYIKNMEKSHTNDLKKFYLYFLIHLRLG